MATFDFPTNPTPAVLRAICDRLRNRAQLEGVNISRHNWDVTEGDEHIILLNGTDAMPNAFLGNMATWHDIVIKGFIFVARDGNTEEASDEAMDRAYELEREMQREFRGSDAGHVLLAVNGQPTAKDISLTRADWDSGPSTTGTRQAFRIDFDLTVKVKTARTAG